MSARGTRPVSAVDDATGLIGAVTLTVLLVIAAVADLSVATASLLLLAGPAIAMITWSLLVGRVHRRASTGLDFRLCTPVEPVGPIVITKLVGLVGTLAIIGFYYMMLAYYEEERFYFYFYILQIGLPVFVAIAPLYIYFTTRFMAEPKDGLWHFGKLVTLQFHLVDKAMAADHARTWAIKGFFLAFMLSATPYLVASVLDGPSTSAQSDVVAFVLFLIAAVFLFDVCFGTIGYICTLRVLDTHVQTANPHLDAWLAALACYPPFLLMRPDGPLDYRSGTEPWHFWLAGNDVALALWGCVLIVLAAFYAWATVVFGLRFSNLTFRGTITTGPYRYVQHPAYFAKNVFWWMAWLPFLSTESPARALENAMILAVINGIYFARAKTEEKHLMQDASYRAYADWIAAHGVLGRARRGLTTLVQGRRARSAGGLRHVDDGPE